MKRVLQGLGSLNMGGAETMVVNVLENLDRQTVTFDFVIPGAEEGLLEPRVTKLGAKVYHTPKRSESFVGSYRAFERVIRENGYQTVHLHTQNAFFTAIHVFLARRAGAKRIVVHSHNTMDWRGGMALRLHKACRKWLYRHADVRLACGREAAEWLFGTTEGVEVLPLPVCCDRFLFDESKREALRSQLGAEERTMYLHVGRFMDVKNHAFLIQVFEEIHRRAPNSLLVLVGDGALRPDIEKQAAQAGLTDSVVFMGNVDNVAELMMAADAMVFPSKYEGFPTVLLEAQAAGLDAFVSDSITKEIVMTGRIHPLSLEQGAQAWADAILQTRRAPNRAADNAAIRERYDVSVAAARLTQIYTQP